MIEKQDTEYFILVFPLVAAIYRYKININSSNITD